MTAGDGRDSAACACIPLTPIHGLQFPSLKAVRGDAVCPPASFRAHYQALVASGAIEADAAQARAAEGIPQALSSGLRAIDRCAKQGPVGPAVRGQGRGRRRAGSTFMARVGRGKTMLMDLFFSKVTGVAQAPRPISTNFMAEVHERIYGFRQNIARGEIAGRRR